MNTTKAELPDTPARLALDRTSHNIVDEAGGQYALVYNHGTAAELVRRYNQYDAMVKALKWILAHECQDRPCMECAHRAGDAIRLATHHP